MMVACSASRSNPEPAFPTEKCAWVCSCSSMASWGSAGSASTKIRCFFIGQPTTAGRFPSRNRQVLLASENHRGAGSKRNSSLPENDIVLSQGLRLGICVDCDSGAKRKNFTGGVQKTLLAAKNSPAIKVHDLRHISHQQCIAGKLNDG